MKRVPLCQKQMYKFKRVALFGNKDGEPRYKAILSVLPQHLGHFHSSLPSLISLTFPTQF